MKTYVICTVLFLCSFLPGDLRAQNEILIEMHGEPSVLPDGPSLWNRTAPQLTRKLRGKTREQVLYAVPVVSDKDRIIRGTHGEYALVEYYDGGSFRKFLFKAESPQTFIAAAANAADVLAVNKKYGLNLGLEQTVFEDFYGSKAQQESSAFLPQDAVLYKLAYTDLNTPKPVDRWFLFEKGALTQTFETSGAKNAYLARLQRRAEEQAKQNRQSRRDAAGRQNRPTRTVRKALISGGTQWDKSYLPRAVNPKVPLFMQGRQTQTNAK